MDVGVTRKDDRNNGGQEESHPGARIFSHWEQKTGKRRSYEW